VDVLSEILGTLELSSQLYFRAELGAPFAIAVPERADVVRFHVVAAGYCVIGLPDGPSLECGPGDLVLVPNGAAHEIADTPGTSPQLLDSVLQERGLDEAGRLRHGGPGPVAVLVCGHFAFGEGPLHPVLSGLPHLLHIAAGASSSYAWIGHVVEHLEAEARLQRSGHREVLRRLSEILLIEVLRASAEAGAGGTLSAIADPQLGRALEALHAAPERTWSLEALARVAGLSRTLLAERFRERLGISPMRYLAHWRVQKARHLLEAGRCSVAEASRRVGYRSESAFHRAFRARFGVAPSSIRPAA
jgi:AraC family transcriptional activator of mtrCDE